MPYSVPTLRQLIASGALDLEASLGTVLPKFGIELALNTSVSAAIRDLYDHQAWIVRQIIPTTESDDQTIIETAQSEGVIRKQATYAAGPATLNGTVPAPVGTVLQHKDGRQYAVTASASPSSGAVAVEVQAVDVGAGGNLAAGEVLTLVTPVPGLQSNGVSGDISGGADIEPIAELLERLLFRKRNPPMGGAVADYVAWMREVPGVTRAWAYDAWQGGGTVGIGWVYDDRGDILPTPTDKLAMMEYLFRHPDPATGVLVGRPGGIEPVDIDVQLKSTDLAITPIPDTADIRAAIAANISGYERTLQPGNTLLLSSIRTAIGSAAGITDYTLDLAADVPATAEELNVIGVITWPTL
ncbi:baseplate J/gp47 family protein [Aeromonas caviae]|uniref:baseplate J/gp47 family protein n=1 Tax=Aeromonas caviae TaxID=648 RepID=UPI001CC3C20A|nr:baseplate J/gp47 family protein [Aeromonas caviae]GJB59028.1 phage baseplate protein [Aeromonas caviae]GKQ70557.1 phage baseplate protein [Aeromonas caviae]GKQ84333.1 phage baseplate protein [Aeromonas caviae]GKQ93184.1 phage baseplate protein [Aeromonas caviae]GKR99027.1 phage baseplate protein [Aeromonas caviae]